MAIARVPNCGYETPLTENPIDFSEFADMDNTLRSRRMSETNLAGPQLYTRPSVTTPGPAVFIYCDTHPILVLERTWATMAE